MECLSAFFGDYCTDCHGPPDEGPESGVSLTADWKSLPLKQTGPVLKRTLDSIEGHSMPPSEMDQPDDDQRARAAIWIRALLAQPEFGPFRDPGRAELRRLTRLEYNNTVRDLLGLETDVFMFSERLPFDKSYFDPARQQMPAAVRVAAREYGAKYAVLLPDAGLPADSRADAEQGRDATVAGKGGLLRVAYGKNANRVLAVNPNEDHRDGRQAARRISHRSALQDRRQSAPGQSVALAVAAGGPRNGSLCGLQGNIAMTVDRESNLLADRPDSDYCAARTIAIFMLRPTWSCEPRTGWRWGIQANGSRD
jgi:hypothetical protein